MSTNNETAKAAYVRNAKLARALLLELNATLSKTINEAMPSPNWGDVGDVAGMVEKLTAIAVSFELCPDDREADKAAEIQARALAGVR